MFPTNYSIYLVEIPKLVKCSGHEPHSHDHGEDKNEAASGEATGSGGDGGDYGGDNGGSSGGIHPNFSVLLII